MGRFQGIGLAAAAMLAWLASSSPAAAQAAAARPASTPADLRREVSELSLKLLEAEAQAAEIKEEQRLLDEEPLRSGNADARPMAAAKGFWETALPRGAFDEGAESAPVAVLAAMDAVRASIEQDEKVAIDAWKSAMDRDLEVQARIFAAEELVGGPASTGGLGGWLSPSLIALGALSVLGGVILTAHEVRDRLRWRLRALGSRPSLIALALAIPLAAALGASPGTTEEPGGPSDKAGSGDPPVRQGIDLEQRRQDIQKKLDRANAELAGAVQQLAPRLEDVRRARAAHALRPVDASEKRAVERIESIEAQVQEQFRKVRVAARLTARVAAEARRLEKKRKDDEIGLEASVLGRKDRALTAGLIRIGACGLFTLALVVPMTLVRRSRRRERDEQSRLCPRCLNKDTLDFDEAAPDAVEGLQARFRLKVCNACEYEIRENYVRHNRLCFPTVGITASGKTHWMIMLYDMIKNANIPVASAIRKIPSREDSRFDDLLRDVLYKSGGPSATVYGLPYPLTFHVHDADPLGANKTMVNLFDFSGEMRNFTIDRDGYRSRALLCEGFTLFLDPTQVSEGSRATIEDQVQTLAHFAEEMHAIRGLPAETPIDMPIAVCVSKMDLLVSKNPMGTQAVPLVTTLRETLTRKVDLSLIHQRSQLCARALPMMFPGWNVERTLRENFGGRYMFFPMSAVGLEGAELGIEDLSRRTIAPFGMIEPLLWLLHMHGYCVLH